MRVLLLTSSYPSSASDPSGHFVQAEARELARCGSVVVVAPGLSFDSTTEAGIVVHRVPGGEAFGWPGAAARLRERPLRVLDAAIFLQSARALLERLGPFDRIVAHWAIPSAFPVADGRLRGVPLEIVSHGADVRLLLALPRAARSLLVRRLLRRADRWRFVSATLRDALLAALDAGDAARVSRVATVRPACISMPDVRERSRELRRSTEGAHLFVCVGRLVPGKRWGAALRHARTHGPTRPKVVVVGDGPLRARLEAEALALGVDARFVGTRPREEALAWIGAADAVLHASKTEGLSTVVREAEALGVPVVVVP